jgi:hypothetical protein
MMAKQVVQLRKQQEKLYKGKAQLSGVAQMAKSANATQTMAKSMATATTAMQSVNATMQPAQMMRDMMEFQRQAEQLDMAQETMYAELLTPLDGARVLSTGSLGLTFCRWLWLPCWLQGGRDRECARSRE